MEFGKHHKIFKYIADWVDNKLNGNFDYNIVCAAVKYHFSTTTEETEAIVKEWLDCRLDVLKSHN